MIRVINVVTYTQYDDQAKVHREASTQIVRNRRLTTRGAQRILRSIGYAEAIVVRIESLIDNR